MLVLENFSVATEHRTLIDNFDLELIAGERVALSGPSGIGKSTLLRAIAGLSDQAGGLVRLDGETPEQHGWPAYRRKVNLLAQMPALMDDSVLANLERPFRYQSANHPFPELLAEEWLDELGLDHSMLKQAARTLSVGEQQRICLLRSLLVGPEVILMDEPTSALDKEATRMVEGLITRLTDEKRFAALIVSHDMRQAERWCQRIVELQPAANEISDFAGREVAS